MATNQSTPSRRRAKRTKAPKPEVDRTIVSEEGVVDQGEGRVAADGPQGAVPVDEGAPQSPGVSRPLEAPTPAAATSQGGPTPEEVAAARALLAQVEEAAKPDILAGVGESFLEAVGEARATTLIDNFGPFVLIEPQVGSIFVPDFVSGPAVRNIGQEMHRYYRPLRIEARQFDPRTRRKIADAETAWIPEQMYRGIEKKSPGSLEVKDRSHASAAEAS